MYIVVVFHRILSESTYLSSTTLNNFFDSRNISRWGQYREVRLMFQSWLRLPSADVSSVKRPCTTIPTLPNIPLHILTFETYLILKRYNCRRILIHVWLFLIQRKPLRTIWELEFVYQALKLNETFGAKL